MTNGDNRTIPVGDIQFSDNYVPALDAGNWFIQADHSLAKDGAPLTTDSLAAIQEAPRGRRCRWRGGRSRAGCHPRAST